MSTSSNHILDFVGLFAMLILVSACEQQVTPCDCAITTTCLTDDAPEGSWQLTLRADREWSIVASTVTFRFEDGTAGTLEDVCAPSVSLLTSPHARVPNPHSQSSTISTIPTTVFRAAASTRDDRPGA